MKSRSESNAFTLIELLVVIGIISLLISILLPSLSSAKQSAKKTVCLSNLRQIGTQSALYLNNYHVFAPVRLKQAPGPGGVFQDYETRLVGYDFNRRKPRWQWFLSENLGPVIDPDKYPDADTFNATMIIENQYFEDPAMSGFENDVRNGAYGYNGTYLGNSRSRDLDGDGTADSWIHFPVSDSAIKDSALTILVGDSRGGASPHGNHSYWLDPPKKAVYGGDPATDEQPFGPDASDPIGKPLEILGHSPVEARHMGKGNIVFVDGHAESLTLPQLGYQISNQRGEVMRQDNPALDRAKANNKLWAGTSRDDPPKEYVYPAVP